MSFSDVAGGSVTVSGSGTASILLTGTVANINNYLASASAPVFNPVANANGPVTLTMVTSDNGNFGSGGTLTDTDSITINVAAVNDAPTARRLRRSASTSLLTPNAHCLTPNTHCLTPNA